MTIRRINNTDRFDRDDIDAAIHTRSVRRCHLERCGLDSVAVAVHLLVETGEAPGWDNGIDESFDGDEWGWAA
ncbi:hypothetical protein [Nocardia sp. NPDC004604]|uniref:hypothetical protein n=1 Tax=Nocardia sp. NPDC004604 TaxID=3157013 RepID=UPI0033B86176